ncbi:hypothetical protein CHL76_08485 [Marinococcus halophilus]|nr:hypothetical protein CHL76_08485 [Marinococcus halophilus]
MLLQKIAYFTNWLIIILGYLLFIPLLLPASIIGDFWVYEYDFYGPIAISLFVFIFGVFGLALSLALQIRHLIILSLILFFLPFIIIAFTLWWY